jgi:uridine kinase
VPATVTAAELADRIATLRGGTPRTVLIAIDGQGGAGKSTLAAWLADTLGDATVVCLDDFARPSVPGWDRRRMIRQVVDPLRAGRPGRYQRWDWATDTGAEWHAVPVGGVVIIEGVSATRRDLSDRWDLTVWVSTPRALRLERGLARDGDAMRRQWLDVWMPEEDAYIAEERPAERADFIVDGARRFHIP